MDSATARGRWEGRRDVRKEDANGIVYRTGEQGERNVREPRGVLEALGARGGNVFAVGVGEDCWRIGGHVGGLVTSAGWRRVLHGLLGGGGSRGGRRRRFYVGNG